MNNFNLVLGSTIIIYFILFFIVAFFASKNSNNESFFIGNKNSNWLLVSFGMIGTSLSGVTFISVPGFVGTTGFTYIQIVFGYLIGYFMIAFILLPIYYKLNLISIYSYLNVRLGKYAYKTGVCFFIISRLLGATARLYLVINVLQLFILDNLQINFYITSIIILFMIWIYTNKGGVKTIVWTDTLQTFCMLFGLVFCSYYIYRLLNINFFDTFSILKEMNFTKIIETDVNSKLFFVKQILAGAFIALTMTGMDQEMMQKNISVKSLKNAKKNMLTIGFMILIVTALFLFLGGLLYIYAHRFNIPANADNLFPTIALQYMPPFVSIIFIIALISALFPSADGAITSLTSSFCIDILGFERDNKKDINQKTKIRKITHILFIILFFILIIVFKKLNNPSMIDIILRIAGYTYGPLLGLFSFAILTKRKLNNKFVFLVCLIAPTLCFILDIYQTSLFHNYRIGLEMLIINGLLTFCGLMLISKKSF